MSCSTDEEEKPASHDVLLDKEYSKTVLYPPKSLLNEVKTTEVPILPSSVDAITSPDVAELVFHNFITVIKELLNNDPMKLSSFKLHAKQYGLNEISAREYFSHLKTTFGPILSLHVIPCLLQLQPNADKRKDLILVAKDYLLQNKEDLSHLKKRPVATGCLFGLNQLSEDSSSSSDEQQEHLLFDDTDSLYSQEIEKPPSRLSIESLSSLVSPSVAATRRENRELKNPYDTASLVSSSVPFMTGYLNVSMFDSIEQLDEDSGKFFTEYKIKCCWKDNDGLTQHWLIARRYREFVAMDILLRESHMLMLKEFPVLPGKRYVGSSMSASFVDKRQQGLGRYVKDLISFFPTVR